MGTPDFAVPILRALVSAGHNVVGVFTQPDKPKGRKFILTPPPVKVLANELNIPVYQPESVKNGEAMPILSELKPDIIVVAAFGMLLKSDVLDFPKYGCINVHGSLLPKYRGAAPIQRAIIDGEKETGITIMQMAQGLDTGDMLLKESVDILGNETAGELFDRLAELGAEMIVKALAEIEKGSLIPEKQDDSKSSYAHMLSKADSPIDWNRTAIEIHNQIRGLSPWPVATTMLEEKTFKIHESRLTGKSAKAGTAPGTVIVEKNDMFVVCGDMQLLQLTFVQPFGSKSMATADFLRGHKIEGVIL